MSSTQRFDGPNLEAVLADVQATHGEAARILNAHRVRAGGIGGFFAKERFEVDVEVGSGAGGATDAGGEDAPAAADEGLHDGPASILDLADEVSARESAGPSSFAALLAARMATEHARAVLGPPAPPAAAAEAEAVSGGPEGWADATDPADDGPADARADVRADATDADGFEALEAPVVARPTFPAEAEGAGRAVYTGALVRAAAAAVPGPAATPALVAVAPVLHPEPVAVGALDPFAARLVRRGLPRALVPVAAGDGRAALVAALDRLPSVPEVATGRASVVATVGERDEAYALALRIGAEHGVDADQVLLASPTYRGRRIPSWHRMTTVEEATSERRAWRRRTTVTVVALEAPVDGELTGWAADMLTALEPNLTWGVVQAGRKTEDLAWWLERLGGLDALAVDGTARTVTPAGVLSLGVPIGLLDGEPATSDGWADVLLAGAGR